MDFKNKIPATKALLILFLAVIVFSFYLGVYVAMSGGWGEWPSLLGIIIIFSGVLLGFLVKMLANIGQILFDIKAYLMNSVHPTMSLEAKETRESLRSNIEKVNDELKELKENCAQINCDTKDLNENMQELKTFFDHIEKQLKLEK